MIYIYIYNYTCLYIIYIYHVKNAFDERMAEDRKRLLVYHQVINIYNFQI